jgi:hypothetical protein
MAVQHVSAIRDVNDIRLHHEDRTPPEPATQCGRDMQWLFETYAANFSALLPRMRSVAAISADVELWRSGRATDITRSQVAAIELQIRNADDLSPPAVRSCTSAVPPGEGIHLCAAPPWLQRQRLCDCRGPVSAGVGGDRTQLDRSVRASDGLDAAADGRMATCSNRIPVSQSRMLLTTTIRGSSGPMRSADQTLEKANTHFESAARMLPAFGAIAAQPSEELVPLSRKAA